MSAVISNDLVVSERSALRRALAVERQRAGPFCEELAHATDKTLHGPRGRKLDRCLARAAMLAITLIDMGEEVPIASVCPEFDRRLLDAMNTRLRAGKVPATTLFINRSARATGAQGSRRTM